VKQRGKLQRFQKAAEWWTRKQRGKPRPTVYPLCRWAKRQGCCAVRCQHPEKGGATVPRRVCAPVKCPYYEVSAPPENNGVNPENNGASLKPHAPKTTGQASSLKPHASRPENDGVNLKPHAWTLPSLSMVITAYNEGEELFKTIQSALAAYPQDRLEIIIVDDGSQPPVSLPPNLAGSPVVKLIRHDVPRGVGASRNAGYAASTGDVISFHDAHMRFPLADELLECCRDEFKESLENNVASLSAKISSHLSRLTPQASSLEPGARSLKSHASSLTLLAAKAAEGDALVCSASRDVRADRSFFGLGADLYYNRRDGLQPKYRLYPRDPDGNTAPYLRVPCMMGAAYFVSRSLAQRLSEPTGYLWEDTAGRWGFSEQALAVKAFLMDIPTLVSRDVFTRHLYRSQNPVPGAGKEIWKNIAVSMSRLLHKETFDLRFKPYCLKRLTPEELQCLTPQVSSLKPPPPWGRSREDAIFTHLCGRNAPITRPHPDHAWLQDLSAEVAKTAEKPLGDSDSASPENNGVNSASSALRILQWRPGESTILLRRLWCDAEIHCIEMPGHRADNWWDICKELGVRLTKCRLGPDYVNRPVTANLGQFDLILIGGEMQAECRRVAQRLLNPGGRIIVNERADRFVIEDNERRKEEKVLSAETATNTPQAPKTTGQASSPKPHASSLTPQASSPENDGASLKPQASRLTPHASITVLLLNWKRPENIGPILECLAAQTARPRIFLWNNGAPLDSSSLKPHASSLSLIQSDTNLGCFPRWWLASAAETEFVCTIDDDLLLRDEKVLEDAIDACRSKCPDGIVGFFGWKRVPGKSYKGARHINGSAEDRRVDLVKGRFMLLRRELLERVPLVPPQDSSLTPQALFRCDDIYINLMISGGRPGYHLVPGVLGKRWVDLKQDSRALAAQPGHWDARNRAVETLLNHFTGGAQNEFQKTIV